MMSSFLQLFRICMQMFFFGGGVPYSFLYLLKNFYSWHNLKKMKKNFREIIFLHFFPFGRIHTVSVRDKNIPRHFFRRDHFICSQTHYIGPKYLHSDNKLLHKFLCGQLEASIETIPTYISSFYL